MSVKVFFGKQTAEGTVATNLLDLGATDFSGGEKYNAVKSEVFNTLQAEGDQFLVGIETSFETPVELNAKVLEALLPSLGYSKVGAETFYRLTSAEPASYTVIISDSLNNKKTVFKDCKLNTLSINAAKGALVNGSLSWIGTTSEFTAGVIPEEAGTDRGESLVAIDSIIELGQTGVTEDVESVTIEISNNLEAKGSIDSLYVRKIKRSAPQVTSATLEFNSFSQSRFEEIKAKAVQNNTENLTITLADSEKTLMLEVPKLYITTSERSDYKGSGKHSLNMAASVNNLEKTPIKFTF
jgi:hypothetical protein